MNSPFTAVFWSCLSRFNESASPGAGGGFDFAGVTRPSSGGRRSNGHNVDGLDKNPCSGMISCIYI